jgi:geranylgeranyl reductase family protein
MINVAIVGGGPAGSYCAYHLAKNDVHPVIFDPTHPREKPCGGLVSPSAQKMLPFLKEIPIERRERKTLCIISPYGKRIRISSRYSRFLCFSRLELDKFLLDTAVKEGAELVEEKVTALTRKGGMWKIKTAKRSYLAKRLVGADGVNSIVRKSIVGALDSKDKGLCYGYLVEGLEDEEIILKFLFHRVGYLWVIPRKSHTSLGIGCANLSRSYGLKKELDIFIKRHYPHVKKIAEWAALIPHIKDIKTLHIPVAGTDWILIGDAAGHVSPVVGEGIIYALLDGELAAEAIVENNPKLFNRLWKETYGWILFRDVKLMKWISKKPFLELFFQYLKFRSLV